MWSLLRLTHIKEMICVLYCSSDFITLEQWHSGCLSVDVHINTCIEAFSWHIGLHEPHIVMCTDQFPKRDLHSVSAVTRWASWPLKGYSRDWGWSHTVPGCAHVYARIVAWYMSMWLGSLKSNPCGLNVLLLETVKVLGLVFFFLNHHVIDRGWSQGPLERLAGKSLAE